MISMKKKVNLMKAQKYIVSPLTIIKVCGLFSMYCRSISVFLYLFFAFALHSTSLHSLPCVALSHPLELQYLFLFLLQLFHPTIAIYLVR